MPEPGNAFPDDVPIADAAEQLQSTADSPDDDEYLPQPADEIPLEASVPDWQEQQETVVLDAELGERG